MIALDASVVIAVLAGSDPHHEAAQAVLAADDVAVIHTMTLAEVLVGGVRIGRLDEMSSRLAEMGVVELERRDREAHDLAEIRAASGLRLPDCCVLLAAESHGAAVATFDARLARQARARSLEVLGA